MKPRYGRSALVLACALGLLGSACLGPSRDEAASARTDLREAWPALSEPDTIELERRLVPLLDARARFTGGERFWAAFALSQAHALEAQHVGGRSDPLHRRASEEVTALYFADIAAAHAASAGAGPDLLLPEDLSSVASEDAALALEFLSLSLLRGLGFDERVARLCRQHEVFLEAGAAARLLERGGIDARLHAGVWDVVFDELEFSDARAALLVAARALVASDLAEGALSDERIEELESFVREDARMQLRCPNCRTPAVPELRSCPNDHTSLERFFVEERASDA